MRESWTKYLSKDDLVHLMEIVNGCLDCVDLHRFTELLYKLKKISKFDAVACTCAEPALFPASLDRAMIPLNCKFPENLMKIWRVERCCKIDVPLQVILSSLNLRGSFDTTNRLDDGRLNIIIPLSNSNNLTDGLIYGAHEKCCNRWILFVFAYRRNNLLESGCDIAIELAVPHLLRAFRSLRYLCAAQPFHLTKREFEILNWVKIGKTTWEIAKMLSVSESCINFHMDNLRKKLDAVNRTHAVVVAVANGIIKI